MLTTAIEPPVREHLKKVYTSLTMSTFAAGAGAYVHVFTNILQRNFLTTLISVGLMLALMMTPHHPKKQGLRLGLLMGVAFFAGLGLGPLIQLAVRVDPSLVATAFLITSVIFVCFSLSAIYSRDGTYLYLGGVLGSVLSVMLCLQIMNIFMQSVALFKMHLYIGLFVFCAFVLYDTQLIIEKRRRGDTDYIWHSLDLFLDLVNIFRHILVILAESQSQDTKRKKKN